MKRKHLLFLLLPLLFAVGCGDSNTAAVTGTVKFPNGTPFTNGMVIFESATTNVIGPLDSQGRFALYQHSPGDRVPPGEYRGMISSEGTTNDAGETVMPFPAKFAQFSTSDLTITVEQGKPLTIDIVLEE